MPIYNSPKLVPVEQYASVCERIVYSVTLNDNECWVWNAGQLGNGYGRIKIGGKHFYAHRVSAQIFHPTFDPKLVVCHECPNRHNKLCINPWHLVQGTQSYNMGHPLTRALISERMAEVYALKNG